MINYILWVFLLFFAYITWRNFRTGLYLILLFIPTYLIKFQFFSIPTTLLELIIYTAFVVWLLMVITKKTNINYSAVKPYFWPIVLIIIGLLAGIIISPDKRLSLGIFKGWFIDPALVFVMLVSSLNKLLHLKKAILALIGSGFSLSLVAMCQVLSNNYITIDQRASALFESANYLSLYLVPIIILALGFVLSLKSKKRWWWLLVLATMSAALYFTFSYSGWLGLLIGLGFGALIYLPFWPTLISGLVLFVSVIATQLNHPKFQQMLDFANRSSSSVRLQVWQSSLLMLKENPILGIGLGLFEKRYPDFVVRLFNPPLEPIMLHAHNLFLHSWLNLGLIGLAGAIWVVVNFFKQVWVAIKQDKNIIAVSVMASMVALLTHGLFDTPYWKNDLSILFWAILAFGIILNQNANTQRRKTSLPDRS